MSVASAASSGGGGAGVGRDGAANASRIASAKAAAEG
jgi:hypothetical protein